MILKNERLQVQFTKIEAMQTQRFDHTAMVSQVMLDGVHTFCTQEQIVPGRRSCNGIGLCGEFVLDGAAEQAKKGEWFCKPGVGLLKQIEDRCPYDMWTTYEVNHFTVTAEYTDHEAIFRQKAIPCGDYGVDIEKRFRLADNCLLLDTFVRNVGTKACCLREYQHNFVCLGGKAISEGYILDLPCDLELARIEQETMRQGDEIQLPSAVHVEGNSVFWKRDLENRVLYHRSEQIDANTPWEWKLYHTDSKLSVKEQTSFCPARVDVWAVEHCICAEFYKEIKLAPGEMAHWQRKWIFEI